MALERFSAAWREAYVNAVSAKQRTPDEGPCVFCALAAEPADPSTGVLARRAHAYLVLNAYPYGSGHVLVVPFRHVADITELGVEEYEDFSLLVRDAAAALSAAYEPDGMNVGMNLGSAAGAGIPEHLHAHVLPRWSGDTNFMTSIGETRVLPESLATTWQKVHGSL